MIDSLNISTYRSSRQISLPDALSKVMSCQRPYVNFLGKGLPNTSYLDYYHDNERYKKSGGYECIMMNSKKRTFMIFLMLILLVLALVSCNRILPSNSNDTFTKKEKVTVIPPSNEITNSNDQTDKNRNGKWQFISRARYIQGSVISFKQSADGQMILNLKVEINYHSSTDPVDSSEFPFKIGQVVEFILKDEPKIDLNKIKRVIIYERQVTTDGKDNFLGAAVKYYEINGKYFDLNGKPISLPPEEYPIIW